MSDLLFTKNADISANGVKFDLRDLERVLGMAVYATRGDLERMEGEIRDGFDKESFATMQGNDEARSRALSHLGTYSQFFLDAATRYANAVRAYEYVARAAERGIAWTYPVLCDLCTVEPQHYRYVEMIQKIDAKGKPVFRTWECPVCHSEKKEP